MVLVDSTMPQLGMAAPDFSLPDTDGRTVQREDFAGTPLLVAFICNHCPFVKHLADAFADFAREYHGKGLAVVAINSNDAQHYPADSPEKMKQEKQQRGYTFPYLYDESQAVAQAYRAACTPDFFLFDAQHRLYYRGQFDASRPNRISSGVYDSKTVPATGGDLRAAANDLLAGRPAPQKQYPSAGCNIKWKPGNEPAWWPGA